MTIASGFPRAFLIAAADSLSASYQSGCSYMSFGAKLSPSTSASRLSTDGPSVGRWDIPYSGDSILLIVGLLLVTSVPFSITFCGFSMRLVSLLSYRNFSLDGDTGFLRRSLRLPASHSSKTLRNARPLPKRDRKRYIMLSNTSTRRPTRPLSPVRASLNIPLFWRYWPNASDKRSCASRWDMSALPLTRL